MKRKVVCCLLAFTLWLWIFCSCNKTKRNANRLDGQRWLVKELSVDGVNVAVLPELKFSECEIYKEDCKGTWYYGNTGHAKFFWQIRNNGKTLIISNQAGHAHTMEDIMAAQQCIDFGGEYEVLECKRNSFSARTQSAHAYPGKKVVLKMERKN
ncbi:MAG: hypothetical protein N3F09_07320 [Bacteroidia bacterium]|nr:hypothetical protein [Bacteroidia bacterium]